MLCNSSIPGHFDANINFEANIVFSTLSIIFFGILSSLLIWFYKSGDQNCMRIHRYILGLFGFTTVLTLIAALSYDKSFLKLRLIYFSSQIIHILCFGIIVMVIGAVKFFDIRRTSEDAAAIGESTGGMTKFVLAMTVPLAIFELFICIGAIIDKDAPNAILTMAGLIQKLLQVGLYRFSLRFKIPLRGRHFGASWYFAILALFNFNMWLVSIIVVSMEEHGAIIVILGGGYSLFASVYAALIIDYRLLVCIIFVEHAVHINAQQHKPEKQKEKKEQQRLMSPRMEHESIEESETFKLHRSYLAGCGYFLGTLLLTSQLLNVLQYTDYLGPWTNIFGIIAELSVILVGLIFVKQVRRQFPTKDCIVDNSHFGLLFLMITMAIIGMVYWILKGVGILIWAVKLFKFDTMNDDDIVYCLFRYFCWNGTKALIRPFSILIQAYVFTVADIEMMCRQRVKKGKINNFLIPYLMLTFLSVFVNSVGDGYSGHVEDVANTANMNMVLNILYNCGGPIQLGFTLHMFVHFFIINSKITMSIFPVKSALKKYEQVKHGPTSNGDDNEDEDDDDNDRTEPLLSKTVEDDNVIA